MRIIPGGDPNPTGVVSVKSLLPNKPVINIPGCPAHPDWLAGTAACFLANGAAPALDAQGRPTAYFGGTVHEDCPNLAQFNSNFPRELRRAEPEVLREACAGVLHDSPGALGDEAPKVLDKGPTAEHELSHGALLRLAVRNQRHEGRASRTQHHELPHCCRGPGAMNPGGLGAEPPALPSGCGRWPL